MWGFFACYPGTEPGGSAGAPQGPPELRAEPGEATSARAASACPAMADAAGRPPRPPQKEQRHLPGSTGAREKGEGFPF